MNEKIELRDIPGYDGKYMATPDGRIYNKVTRRWLKLQTDNRGYSRVYLNDSKGKYFKTVHQLVATAHIPNPEGKLYIDHINTIRTDNRVENLRWVTYSENNNNPLTRQHISDSKRGRKLTKEHREKLSAAHIGMKYPNREYTKEWLQHIREANAKKKGTHWSEEMRTKMEGRFLGSKSALSKPVLQYSLDGTLIKRWDCIQEACRELGIKYSSAITQCLNGKSKSSHGYIWKKV